MSERPAGDQAADREYEATYIFSGTVVERMALSSLLDWLDAVREQHDLALAHGDADRVRRHAEQLQEAEAALVTWREGLSREPGGATDLVSMGALGRAVRRGDVYLFKKFVPGLVVASLGEAARRALRFMRPGDRIEALEETVLVGEARVLGIEEARRRRIEWRDGVVHGLQRRVVDVMASRSGWE